MLVIGGGFAVVVAVNMLMAVLATRSFTGLVVPNGYVASQDFNRGLAAGRAQKALGWTPELEVTGSRVVLEVAGPGGAPLTGLSAVAELSHPVDRSAPVDVRLREGPAGAYAATLPLAPGAYDLKLVLVDGAGHRHVSLRRIAVEP
jgi:nitrogen fixation protein FixH